MKKNKSAKHLEQSIVQAFVRKGEQQALSDLANISSTQELKKIISAAERRHKPSLRRRILWVSASVAAVVLLLLAIGFQPRYSTGELYASWHDAVVYESIVSRGDDETAEKQQAEFENALLISKSGRTDEAIQIFLRISSDDKSEYAEDACWQLALLYLKNDERIQAKEVLRMIVAKPGEYNDKAKQLLNKIEQKRWF